jgi:ABC-type transport system involved in cytochrome c biogenesis permease subunit
VIVIALLLYAAAAVLYMAHFVRRSALGGRVATGVFASAALAHTFVIGMQSMEVGHPPFVGAPGAITGFVWLLALVYLYTEFTSEERAMGVLIAPLCALLLIIPAMSGRVAPRPPLLESPLFSIHVTSLLSAYAAFALACVIGITYVLLFKEIKAKHLGFFYARLPSLQTLDAMNARAVTVGWVLLSVGVLAGAVWIVHARQYMPEDPRLQAMSLFDPKIFVALLSWAVYSFQIYARRAIGLSGRRAAWLSAIGFAIVLLNFLPVAYFFTRSHNFY